MLDRIFPCNCVRGSWAGNIALELIGEDFVTKWPVLIYLLLFFRIVVIHIFSETLMTGELILID